MSNPIRGICSAYNEGNWNKELKYVIIRVEDELSALASTEVDIYPAGEPRYTEAEFAERLHSMLIEVEELQEDTLATSALVADMFMVDNEDVPVFGVLRNIHDADESFEEDKYLMEELPTVAVEKAIEVLENEKRAEDMTFTELLEKLRAGLVELAAAIDNVRA